jgi:hypothetical protein
MLNQNLKRKVYFESKAKRNKRRKFRKILVFCLFASIFFLSFYFFNKFIDGKTFAKYTSTNFTSPKKENVVNIQDVQSKLQTVVNSHPEATIGISYIDLKSGTTANVNGDTAFTAASTGKMIPAIMFLQGVENGKYSLSQRYGSLTGSYLLKQMINRSNNDCWATFNNLLGLANEQAFAAKLGLNYNPYKNTLSANDYATLLSKLYNN